MVEVAMTESWAVITAYRAHERLFERMVEDGVRSASSAYVLL
jgi:hypothetical protein